MITDEIEIDPHFKLVIPGYSQAWLRPTTLIWMHVCFYTHQAHMWDVLHVLRKLVQ